MKQLAIAWILVAATACGASGGRSADPRTLAPSPPRTPLLTIVSWNLHEGEGDLDRLVASLTGPYVLLLQEAVYGSRPFTAFAGTRTTRRGQLGNAIVTKLPATTTSAVDLPQERQRRRAVIATLDLGGQPLTVVTTHLENRVSWWRGGLFSEGARARQARALVEALPAATPLVLGGDLNTWLGSGEPALRLLFERFPATPRPRLPAPTFRQRLTLDHLFFDLPAGWSAESRVLSERYGSDHHPVLGLIFQ